MIPDQYLEVYRLRAAAATSVCGGTIELPAEMVLDIVQELEGWRSRGTDLREAIRALKAERAASTPLQLQAYDLAYLPDERLRLLHEAGRISDVQLRNAQVVRAGRERRRAGE